MAEPLKNQTTGVVVGAVAVALIAGIVFLATRPSAPPAQQPRGRYSALLNGQEQRTTPNAQQAQLDYIQWKVDQIQFEQNRRR